ncbi:hypothetical protein GEMRC1_006133 [Eukaryota sp. GEM-RC1]
MDIIEKHKCAHPKCDKLVPVNVHYKNGTCSSLCSKRLSDLLYRRKIRDMSAVSVHKPPKPSRSSKESHTIPIYKPIPLKPRPMHTGFLGFQSGAPFQPPIYSPAVGYSNGLSPSQSPSPTTELHQYRSDFPSGFATQSRHSQYHPAYMATPQDIVN